MLDLEYYSNKITLNKSKTLYVIVITNSIYLLLEQGYALRKVFQFFFMYYIILYIHFKVICT